MLSKRLPLATDEGDAKHEVVVTGIIVTEDSAIFKGRDFKSTLTEFDFMQFAVHAAGPPV